MIHFAIITLLLSSLPVITNYPSIRNVGNLGPVVADIESHLPKGNIYRESDLIGWVHEGTHGINSQLRERFKCLGFYVLGNRAILLKNAPKGKLSSVAKSIPLSLRGMDYHSHLIQSQYWWESEPGYLFDEFVAYTNGSKAWISLGRRSHRSETVKLMVEYIVYSTAVVRVIKSTDKQTKRFLTWQIKRSMKIYKASGIRSTYLDRLRNSVDATELRLYMRDYFGLEFTRNVLGF